MVNDRVRLLIVEVEREGTVFKASSTSSAGMLATLLAKSTVAPASARSLRASSLWVRTPGSHSNSWASAKMRSMVSLSSNSSLGLSTLLSHVEVCILGASPRERRSNSTQQDKLRDVCFGRLNTASRPSGLSVDPLASWVSIRPEGLLNRRMLAMPTCAPSTRPFVKLGTSCTN